MHPRLSVRLSGFSALTINYLLMALAVEMVGSFGVLFVWQLGRDWREGILLILLLFGFQRLIVGLIVFPIGQLYARIPHQWIMAAAQVALVAKLLILSIASTQHQPIQYGALLLAFALGGFYIASYYVGFHSLFLFDTSEQNVGKGIGLIDMLGRFSGVIAPLLAGILVDRFGFSVMFITAIVILLCSSVPLFLMRHRRFTVHAPSVASVFGLLRHQSKFAQSVYFWLIEDAIGGFFWPIFLILVLKNYAVFGAIGSLVMMTSSVMVYIAGFLYDRQPLRRIFPGAALAVGVMWVIRFLSRTPLTVGTADVLYRVISPAWWMKIRRNELAVGEEADHMTFAIAHELMITFGDLTGLVLGYWLLVMSHLNWYWLLLPTLGGIFMSVKVMKDI